MWKGEPTLNDLTAPLADLQFDISQKDLDQILARYVHLRGNKDLPSEKDVRQVKSGDSCTWVCASSVTGDL